MTDYYTFKEIVDHAKKIKSNVEKEYKLGENQQWGYFIARAIMTPNKNVDKWYIKPAGSPSKEDVDVQINKSSYEDMARRFIKYVNTYKQMPNYITYKTKHIKVDDYCYMFARILVYYYEHGQFPNYANVNSASFKKPTNKKYGHSTKSGCDNMGQNTGYYCGPHMVQEIIRNLTGRVIPQKTLAGVIGTTSNGSGHQGINTAFAWFNKNYGFNLQVEWKNFSDLGWEGINKILNSTNQDCGLHELYRDTYGHYTNYDKVYNNTVDVHNSLGNKCNNGCYCGYIENRSKLTAKRYLNGISQKSVIVVTKK